MEQTKAARIEKLRNSTPIEITGKEIKESSNVKEYAKNALRYGLDNLRGEYTSKDTGKKISVSRGSLEEVLHHNITEVAHIQSVAAIPKIIEDSIYIDTLPNLDKAKNPKVKSYDYHVAGLVIGGVDYTVKAVIANGNDGTRYYDHLLTQVEKGKLLEDVNQQGVISSSASSGLSSNGAPGEQGNTIPATKGGKTYQSPKSCHKDRRLISILQTKS